MDLTYHNKILELHKKYPWLKITTTIEDYIAPKYYDQLLKDYIFSGKTDLRLFEEYLEIIPHKDFLNVLELGCGSGRAMSVFLNYFKDKKNCQVLEKLNHFLLLVKEKFLIKLLVNLAGV